MRKILIAATAAVALGAAGAVIAGESSVPVRAGSNQVSSDSIRKGLEGMGYRVAGIEAEHDSYEIRAVDGDTGLPIKATYDAATGDLVKAKVHR
jgi:peptidase YpeB-like protein